jgi:hypothetical protein
LVHIWSTTHRNPTVASGRQRSPAVHHSRRCQVRSWGNRPGGRTLIRMKSEVQLLPGPPPVPAGQSAAGLGRAGAARPAPPAHPVAPPGPPTRASGSTTTTHRGRAPSPRTAATRHAATSRCSLLPCPQRSRPRRALRTPAWPAWSLSGQARPPRPAPNPAARVRHRPPSDQRDVGSVARVPPRGPSIEPSTARQPPGPPPVPVVTVARPPRPWSPAPPPEWEETDASGPTGQTPDGWTPHGMDSGQRTDGRWTGGQQPADRRTLWTTIPGDRTPDGWTAGSRTPKPGGWTPPGGHRRPTPLLACWPGRPRRRRPTARDRLEAAPGKRRLGEQPPGPLHSKDAEGSHAATDGSGHRRDRQLPVVGRRPAGASAHCPPRINAGRA